MSNHPRLNKQIKAFQNHTYSYDNNAYIVWRGERLYRDLVGQGLGAL